MSAAFLFAWARAFILTQLIETPIYLYGYGTTLGIGFCASAITHPIVWFLFFGYFSPIIANSSYIEQLVIAETFAWLVEAGWISLMTRRPHALAWAFIANLTSTAFGLASRALFDFS